MPVCCALCRQGPLGWAALRQKEKRKSTKRKEKGESLRLKQRYAHYALRATFAPWESLRCSLYKLIYPLSLAAELLLNKLRVLRAVYLLLTYVRILRSSSLHHLLTEGEDELRMYVIAWGVRSTYEWGRSPNECESYVVGRTDSEGILLRILHYDVQHCDLIRSSAARLSGV